MPQGAWYKDHSLSSCSFQSDREHHCWVRGRSKIELFLLAEGLNHNTITLHKQSLSTALGEAAPNFALSGHS